MGRLASIGIAQLVTLLLITAPAACRELSWDYVLESYPDELSFVTTCGYWEAKGERGFFRVASAEFLFGGSRLWIQWMRQRDENGRTSRVATLPLHEINDEHASYYFKEVRCSESNEGIVVTVVAESGHSMMSYEFKITLSETPGVGEVGVTEIPNTGGD